MSAGVEDDSRRTRGGAWPPHLGRCGMWVKIPALEVIEILAAAGADFVVVDCEHGAIDRRTMSGMVGLARAAGLPAFVRVPSHSPPDVQPPLDAGASGLFLPHIDTADAAVEAVRNCRYPPLGRRGASPSTRAGGWGSADQAELVSNGNTRVTLVAQIESPSAVADIDAIARVDGLDALFVGPLDLALSAGLATTSAAFTGMVSTVERAVADRRPLGGVAVGPAEAGRMFERGYAFALVGVDTSVLAAGARALLGGHTRDQ